MAHALAPAQHVWDCRWSKFGFRLTPTGELNHSESGWLCERDPGTRRPVTEEECATCSRWEQDPRTRQ